MIRLENLSKYYYSESGVTVGLDRISLELKKGEFVAITGESGSGKSTLLRVLGGTDTYEDGEFFFENQPTSYYGAEEWEEYRNRKIAFVYQDYRLIDSYTVLQNVECALILREVPRKDQKRLALQYLEQVGLADLYRKKAANLSSGQRQRLSIARALAKNTDIIVADEPTGNLDRENGAAVMELLYRLSAQKLVVVVTHNYEQAAPYATRKIRLHDGSVTEDRQINPPCPEEIESAHDPAWNAATETADGEKKKSGRKKETGKKKRKASVVWELLRFNRSAQPRRYLFLGMILLGMSFGFFVLMGTIFSQMDEVSSRYYQNEDLPNGDKTRLLVQKQDESAMGQEDVEAISEISHVEQTDQYGLAADIAVYYGEGQGYQYTYRVQETEYQSPDSKSVFLMTSACYLRSASCLSEEQMKEGEIPTGYYEAAVSEGCGLQVGETVPFYLVDTTRWEEARPTGSAVTNTGPNYICAQMKITGIVEGEEPQVYFSCEYVKYLTADDGTINHFFYHYLENYWDLGKGVNRNTRGVKDVSASYQNMAGTVTGVKMSGTLNREETVLAKVADAALQGALPRYLEYLAEQGKKDNAGGYLNYWAETVLQYYDGIPSADGAILDTLTEALVNTGGKSIGYRRQNAILVCNPELQGNFIRLSTDFYDNNIIVSDGEGFGYPGDPANPDLNKKDIVSQYAIYPLAALAWQPDQNKVRDGRTQGSASGRISDVTDYEGTPRMLGLTVDPAETAHGVNIYEISREVFEQIYPELDSEQITVYIEDYVYTDDVLADLKQMGYEAISVFRAGSVAHDLRTVQEMLKQLAVSAGILAAVFLLGIVLQYVMWALKQKDFQTLSLLGLKRETRKKLLYADLGSMVLSSMLLAALLLSVLSACHVERLYDLMKYYRWYHYLLLAVLHGVYLVITVFFINRSMNRMQDKKPSGKN